ncbi:hypothetical protein TUM12129_50960 (plasmid) [Klebsiella pneumoniae]|nr:hypothetical protein TUM12129_50960 [Klebsiella pneumoniae]
MKALPATDGSGQDTKGRSLCESGCGKVFTASVITPIWLNGKLSGGKD